MIEVTYKAEETKGSRLTITTNTGCRLKIGAKHLQFEKRLIDFSEKIAKDLLSKTVFSYRGNFSYYEAVDTFEIILFSNHKTNKVKYNEKKTLE